MSCCVLIVAAGRGTRAGGDIPKQYQSLAGMPVLQATLEAFAAHREITHGVVVLHPEDSALFETHVTVPKNLPLTCVPGAESRDGSVRAGLDALPLGTKFVLIHDAARPLVSPQVIDGVLEGLQSYPGAAPAVPVVDALWCGDAGRVIGMADRSGLYRAQTPQGFHVEAIRAAHAAHPGGAKDDVEVARAHGLDVAITAGDEDNLKITHPGDFARAAKILAWRADRQEG